MAQMDLWQIVRFNIAGALATAVHLAVVWAAAFVLGWSLLAANVVAFLVANTASYFLQSRWTFRLRPQTRRRWYGASLVTLALAGGVGRAADVLMPGPSSPEGVAARVSRPPSLPANRLIFCSALSMPPSRW